jgi:hypothetical protein
MLLMRWRRRRLQALETPPPACHRSRGACTASSPSLAPAEALLVQVYVLPCLSLYLLALSAPQPAPEGHATAAVLSHGMPYIT